MAIHYMYRSRFNGVRVVTGRYHERVRLGIFALAMYFPSAGYGCDSSLPRYSTETSQT